MRSLHSFRGAIALLALVAVAAGCGEDEAASVSSDASVATMASTTENVDTTSAAPTSAAPTTAAPATDPPVAAAPASTSVPAEPAGDDGSCLVGDWVITDEQMGAFYDGLMGTVEAPLTIDTVGSAPLSFRADGTYEWAPAFDLTVEAAGQVGTGVVSGSITGNWSAVDGVVATTSDVNGVEVSVTVAGVTFSGSDLANGLLNSSPVSGVTYSCEGPVLDFQTADPGVTVPVTLVRR